MEKGMIRHGERGVEVLNLRGRRITVVGAGISGKELALLACRLGARVFVSKSCHFIGVT